MVVIKIDGPGLCIFLLYAVKNQYEPNTYGRRVDRKSISTIEPGKLKGLLLNHLHVESFLNSQMDM